MRTVRLAMFDESLHSEALHTWLNRPHVARWWGDPKVALEHAVRCRPEVHAVIIADGTPIGYLCWQVPTAAELEGAGLADLPERLVDIDILIGEPDLLGLGIGPQALRLLLDQFSKESSYSHAGLGTSVSNVRAIRAFEKAGFRLFRQFQDPELGPCWYMVAQLRAAA